MVLLLSCEQWRWKQHTSGGGQTEGDGSFPAGSRGGAPVGGLGEYVQNMYKIWSNLTKNFKNLALL